MKPIKYKKIYRGMNSGAIEVPKVGAWAYFYPNGEEAYYVDGLSHREDGPAQIYSDGSKYWRFHDKSHRIGGPAVEFSDGSKEWWIYGNYFDEKQYWVKLVGWGYKINNNTEAITSLI